MYLGLSSTIYSFSEYRNYILGYLLTSRSKFTPFQLSIRICFTHTPAWLNRYHSTVNTTHIEICSTIYFNIFDTDTDWILSLSYFSITTLARLYFYREYAQLVRVIYFNIFDAYLNIYIYPTCPQSWLRPYKFPWIYMICIFQYINTQGSTSTYGCSRVSYYSCGYPNRIALRFIFFHLLYIEIELIVCNVLE